MFCLFVNGSIKHNKGSERREQDGTKTKYEMVESPRKSIAI